MTEPKADGATYDVFLSHNSADKPAVLALAERLRDEAGLAPFLDSWHLVPGEPWQEALEAAIDTSRTCAVFVGPAGFGTWENEEMRAALSRRASNEDFRVIPVILPGAVLPDRGRLPRFLSRLTWVDFRTGLDDAAAFDRLVNGIRGLAPDSGDESVQGDAPIVCPFRGLEVFDEEHAEYFFGREALTQYLVEQVRNDRFLAVVGASGSGKSSVVRAGLVPNLRAGGLPGSGSWSVVVVKPGPHPLEALASRLAAVLMPGGDVLAARDSVLAKLRENERGLHAVVQTTLGAAGVDARVLIVVDQFEEIFTLCHDDAERGAFVDGLLYASSLVGGQAIVVLTMRADFFGKSATLPVLAARLAEGDVLVPPMEKDELRRAMIQPAEKVGLQFEKGLVDTILDDLGGEPGSLPLLQHTLFELFEGRRDRWLTIDHYHAIGGVRGAIAQRAEAIYTQLTPDQQLAARRILLRLTEPGEGTEETRRRAPISELLPTGAPPDAVEAVVNQLTDARLLVTSETETGDEVVDVAHEALIRGWPRLQAWIDENPAALRVHRRLTETSTEWSATSRDPSYLFSGSRLDEARRWAADNADDLNELEREFLAASDAARLKEAASRRRRIRLAIGGTAAAFVAVTLAGVFAAIQWREATRNQHAANAQFLLAFGREGAQKDPLVGIINSFEGLDQAHLAAPIDFNPFLDGIKNLIATGRYALVGSEVDQVFPSPDGKYMVVDVNGGVGTLVRTMDGATIAPLGGEVRDAQFAGGLNAGVFSVTYKGKPGTAMPSELRRTSDGALGVLSGEGFVQISLSPDPRAQVIGVTYTKPSGAGDVSLRTEPAVGVLVGFRPGDVPPGAASAAPAPPPAELRSVRDGKVVRILSRPSDGSWFLDGPDGPVIAVSYPTSSDARDVELFRATDASPIGLFRSVEQVEFVGSGNERIVTRDAKGCALWDAGAVARLSEVPDCAGYQSSPDGSAIAFFTERGGVVQRTSSGKEIATLPDGAQTVTFSPDVGASRMVVLGSDVPGQVLQTEGAKVVIDLHGPVGSFSGDSDDPSLAFSADGRFLFASTFGRAGIYEAATGAPVSLVIPGGTGPDAGEIRSAEFSSSAGGPALVAFNDGRRAVFDLTRRQVLVTIDSLNELTFWLGEGPILVNGQLTDEGPGIPAELRDATSGDLVVKLGGALIDSVRFSSETDAQAAVVTFSTGYTPEHFALPELIGRDGSHVPLSAPIVNLSDSNADSSIRFSPDASALVVRYTDGHTEVWDRKGKPRMLIDLGLGITTSWIDPAGAYLATWDRNGTAYLMNMRALRSLPPDGEPVTEEGLFESLCGLLRDTDKLNFLPYPLTGRCG